jgi:alpha-beta hydrolase superfamily lysophospholipase
MKLESGPFPSRDGTRLYGEWHRPQGTPRGVALVMHGYADHGGRYVEVSQKLTGIGIAALAIDYRGHGRADGRRGHCDRFVEYLEDLDAALARARHAVPNGPLLLVTHSHGGLVALRALTDPARAPRVDGVVLSSPFLGVGMPVPQAKVIAGRVASRILPALSMPNGLRIDDFTHDEEIKRATRADHLRHEVATARWFTEATTAQEFVQSHAHRLTVPSLWLVGAADPVVSVEATRRAYEHAGGEKQLKMYEGYFHEIFNEVGRAIVFQDLTQWISSKFLAS